MISQPHNQPLDLWRSPALTAVARLPATRILVAIVAVGTLLRGVAAFWVRTPVYYSDEYLYSQLARSIARTGWPAVRGHFVAFPALLGPYLMAPAWIAGGPALDYRLAQLLAAAWFATAAVPIYLLARRVDLDAGSALFVAALGLLVPDGVLTATVMTEPYAYPLFFWTVLAAVSALTRPTWTGQARFLALCGVLCLVRFEFVVLPALYLLAALGLERRLRAVARRHWLALAAPVAAGLPALAAVASSGLGRYQGVSVFRVPVAATLGWAGVNLFVVGLCAGWVVLPAAITGFGRLLRGELPQRAFAIFSVSALGALVLEAAVFGVNDDQVIERYTFYAVPLVLIAFCRGLAGGAGGRASQALGLAAAATVLLVPLTATIRRANDHHAPSLFGLRHLTRFADPPDLIWATALALAVILVARSRSRRVALPVTAAVVAVAALGAASGLTGIRPATDVHRLSAPRGSGLVVPPEGDPYVEMQTLFWNPGVARVVALGATDAPDGFWATSAAFAPRTGGFAGNGVRLSGSFELGLEGAYLRPGRDAITTFDRFRAPAAVVFGWSPLGRNYLHAVGRVLIAAGAKKSILHVRVVSDGGPQTINLTCTHAGARDVTVTRRAVTIAITAPAGSQDECRLALVGGLPEVIDKSSFGSRVLRVWMTTA